MTRRDISRILFHQWDPLGVNADAPADEYDDYAQEIERLLGTGESVDGICRYLTRVRAEYLLMAPDHAQDRRIAEAIAALD